ncbi:MAG: FkbM family methyltransferase [Candidatus Accumulibacter sp.]|nr:FkbM family methyltransferase [Accumulibacter sp.]
MLGGGGGKIPCIPLDNRLSGENPVTLIKMDIQGFEAHALHGASELISRDRPVLAISVYHHPYDLYDLPLFIKHIVPDYKFVLRAYTNWGDEVICYAIPPERMKLRT